MELAEVRERFKGALDEIVESCQITEEFVDKDIALVGRAVSKEFL